MPKLSRRRYVLRLLGRIARSQETTAAVVHSAKAYEAQGIRALDALHPASAVEAGAAYCCSCDDKLLERGLRVDTGAMKVVSPLERVGELEP